MSIERRQIDRRICVTIGTDTRRRLKDRRVSPAVGEFAIQQLAKLGGCIISGFYEEEYPIYTQGVPTHELQSIATADEINSLVNVIRRLKDELNLLKTSQPGSMELNAFSGGGAAGVTGQTYLRDGVIAGLDDGDHQPDGNRDDDIATIAIGVCVEGETYKTLLTWRQAREYADAILTLINLAEFG